MHTTSRTSTCGRRLSASRATPARRRTTTAPAQRSECPHLLPAPSPVTAHSGLFEGYSRTSCGSRECTELRTDIRGGLPGEPPRMQHLRQGKPRLQSEANLVPETKDASYGRVMKRPRLSPALFALICLAFVLPFATVSCDNAKTSFTGLQLVTHTVPSGGAVHEEGDCSGELGGCVESQGSLLAALAFGMALG